MLVPQLPSKYRNRLFVFSHCKRNKKNCKHIASISPAEIVCGSLYNYYTKHFLSPWQFIFYHALIKINITSSRSSKFWKNPFFSYVVKHHEKNWRERGQNEGTCRLYVVLVKWSHLNVITKRLLRLRGLHLYEEALRLRVLTSGQMIRRMLSICSIL